MIRKLLLTTAILLIVVARGAAQDVSARYQGQIIGSRGTPLANQNVAVCTQPANTNTQPCSPLAVLGTSTSTTTGGTNPLTSDNIGNFFFYVPPGKYTIQIYGPQVGTPHVTPDILIGQSLAGGLTSVGLGLPVEFVVTGSPVTTAGTLTGSWKNEIPNTVFAGPGLNPIGGVFDGQATNTGTGTAAPTTPITPTTAHDWAFVVLQAQTLTQTGIPTMPGSWTRNFNNGNAAAVFNKEFNTSATISDTVTLNNSASWINSIVILRLVAGTPTIVQQTSASGASAFTTAPFGSNITAGSSILAMHCGVPPSSQNFTGTFSDSAGDGYTTVSYIQNGSAEVCNVALSTHVTGGSAPTVTFTPALSGTYANSFSLSMELSNLQPSNGQPAFRNIGFPDLPTTVGTVQNITVGNLSPLFLTSVINPTTSPAVTFSQLTASANTVFAGPTSGGSVNPTFRALVPLDLPTMITGTATMTTALIGAGACGSTVTVTATGATTSNTIAFSYSAAPAANPAQLVISSWPTTNNVNFQYCNPTAAGITPNAATLNWSIPR